MGASQECGCAAARAVRCPVLGVRHRLPGRAGQSRAGGDACLKACNQTALALAGVIASCAFEGSPQMTISRAFLIVIGLQAAHSVEEIAGHVYRLLP